MRTLFKKSDDGFVVALAMIAIMTLSFVTVTAAVTTRATTRVAGNYSRSIETFNIAEVGIAKARPTIEAAATFSTLLASYSGTPLVSSTAFNEGFYEVTLTDNDDGDGDLTADTDNIIILTSIGTNAIGGQVIIETYLEKIVGINTPPDPPGGPTAGLLCGANSQVGTTGSAGFEGCDYDMPATLPCTGAACDGTLIGDNDSSGDCSAGDDGGYAAAAEYSLTTSGSGYEGATASATTDGLGSSSNCDDWETVKNQLASLPAGTPGVTVWNSSGVSGYDNCSSSTPGIFIIDSVSGIFTMSGNTCLQGIIIVASETTIKTTGTATITGIIMVSGSSAGNANIDASSGTANVFGEFITFDDVEDPEDEVFLKGSASVKYSTTAKALAEQALNNAGVGGGGAILTVSWAETY